MKNRANKAIYLISTLMHVDLVELKTGNMAPLYGRNAKLTRLFLQSLPEAEKTAIFERIEQSRFNALVDFMQQMTAERLVNFMREVIDCQESNGESSIREALQDMAA